MRFVVERIRVFWIADTAHPPNTHSLACVGGEHQRLAGSTPTRMPSGLPTFTTPPTCVELSVSSWLMQQNCVHSYSLRPPAWG